MDKTQKRDLAKEVTDYVLEKVQNNEMDAMKVLRYALHLLIVKNRVTKQESADLEPNTVKPAIKNKNRKK